MKLSSIKRKHKDRWVLLKPTKKDEHGWVEEGEVLAESKSRSYITKRVSDLKPKHFTILYTGTPKKLPRI